MHKPKKITLTVQILIAAILGAIVGVVFGDAVSGVKVLGDIFLRLIQMSIVLLVMGQIIEAVGSINPRELGKMGVKTVVIFLGSSLAAAVCGMVFGLVFQPGAGVDTSKFSSGASVTETAAKSISDTILDFFPSNVIQSMANGVIVQVIVFAILFGVALSYKNTERDCSTFINFIKIFNEVILKLVSIIMKVAPLGVFALICSSVGSMGVQVILPMIKYLGVYALGTLVFLLLWLVVSCIYARVGFARLVKNMLSMSIMALATTSSAVTLPVALNDTEKKLGVGEQVAKLVLPLGMPLNSNGSAMHMAITIITIAQIYGIQYAGSQWVYVVILATLASLANAVVPGAGLVSLTIVVPAMGLPLESIALFAGIDWFVGMLRTILNVDSDALTALAVAKSEGQLDKGVFYQKVELDAA